MKFTSGRRTTVIGVQAQQSEVAGARRTIELSCDSDTGGGGA